MITLSSPIKAIIGLGNPGNRYYNTHHSIGFQVVDKLARVYNATWTKKEIMERTEIIVDNRRIFLIKPLTYMNDSGKVIPFLLKKGIKPDEILVVHDELEFPFGKTKIKFGGSARGHNGLRSIINVCGKDFARCAFGIGRPEKREEVGDYVLQPFQQSTPEVQEEIDKAVNLIETILKEKNK